MLLTRFAAKFTQGIAALPVPLSQSIFGKLMLIN